MLKRTLTFIPVAATVGLLAGGVSLATPAIADDEQLAPDPDSNVEYPAWTGDFTVNVNTRGWEWIPSLKYSFKGKNIVDAPCPGGWGPDHQPSANFEQICRFDLSTDAQDGRNVVIAFLGGTTITDPKTENSKTIEDFAILVEEGLVGTGSYWTPVFAYLEKPQSPLPNGFDVSLEGERAKNSNYTLNVEVPENLFAATLQTVNESPVSAAADVQAEPAALGDDAPADDAPSDDANTDDAPADDAPSDDTSSGDSPDSGTGIADPSDEGPAINGDDGDQLGDSDNTTLATRSKSLTTGEHQVVEKHHTRVEKMATKVHNQGGVLTIHAYGPDEDLALARARAVRAHLEAQLAKRGHSESSPIWVTYAGDPDHKKDAHVTIHWHPDTTLPGALPGSSKSG